MTKQRYLLRRSFLPFLKEGLKWDQGTCVLEIEKRERKIMNAYCPA